MRTKRRAGALVLLIGGLLVGVSTPVDAAPDALSWTPELVTGQAAGVTVTDGIATLDPTQAAPAGRDAAPTGLLTLPARWLVSATDRIVATIDGFVPAGATATVDVRGRRSTGNWTEWIPADPAGATTLPQPATQVQARLVLTGRAEVRRVALRAAPAAPSAESPPALGSTAPVTYRVVATREGLVGRTTANGHTIDERDYFVALPSRRVLSPRDYSVKVCARGGRCAFAPVWDVGPWNTRDDYWSPPGIRKGWPDLPQGVPQAQAAFRDGYHRGVDHYGRRVTNPAGVDLADGVFWDALRLRTSATVTVEYLWTGSTRLATIIGTRPADVRAAPAADATVVGLAAPSAGVPVLCAAGEWLRIGARQYVAAATVPGAGRVPPCVGLIARLDTVVGWPPRLNGSPALARAPSLPP